MHNLNSWLLFVMQTHAMAFVVLFSAALIVFLLPVCLGRLKFFSAPRYTPPDLEIPQLCGFCLHSEGHDGACQYASPDPDAAFHWQQGYYDRSSNRDKRQGHPSYTLGWDVADATLEPNPELG